MAGRVIVPVPTAGRTITAPVAFNGLQAAINAATTGTTVVVASGSYTLSAAIVPKTGVWIVAQNNNVTISPSSGTQFSTLVFDLSQRRDDVWISGFTIDGTSSGDGSGGLININQYCDGIHIVNNQIINHTSGIVIWAGNRVYVQGNLFQSSIANSEAISSRMNGGVIDTQIISDNEFVGSLRFTIETGHYGDSPITNFHCDRNLVHGTGGSGLSIIGYYGSGTVWGNEVSGRSGSALELGGANVASCNITCSENYTHGNTGVSCYVAHGPGSVYENNNLSSGFVKDGGWDGTEWIGVNTINGSPVTGAFGATYGAKPATFAPSSSPAVTGPGQLFFGATEIQHVYLGTTEIKKIYLGNILLFDVTGGAPPGEATADSTSITADSTAHTADET